MDAIHMKTTQIPLKLAQRLALHAQLLDGRMELPEGKNGVAQLIEKLGYIQIDTIAVIQRAHHHTLWTRRPDYDSEMLHALQAVDRRVFEYWGHAMSYMPIADYRYCIPKMRNFNSPKNKWAKMSLEKCGQMMQPVLERIRKDGPLGAKDFEAPPGKRGGTWWDWKPAKLALEMLFWKGDLMITERRNFQKIYDLTERVLPNDIDTSIPSNDELGHFIVRRALSAYGVAREREIRSFMQPEAARDSDIQAASKDIISNSLNNLIETGEVIQIQIEEKPDVDYCAFTETVEKSGKLKQSSMHVSLLSPFDNLIIQRDRIKHLFDFDYTLECYVPAARRTYGYFVLPVLWGDSLVGRLDPKADRKQKTLIINSLVFEPEFDVPDNFLPSFADKLKNFARFNACDNIVFEKISPKKIEGKLKKLVKI
jgi:uncharacterized protein YcaQ